MGLDIRDESTPEELVLALYVEGERWATARASADVLLEMSATMKRPRSDVERDLQAALERLHAQQLEKVSVDPFMEEPPGSRRFIATFTYRDHHDVSRGIVWYDMSTGATGPEPVPALVRNKLRYAVHEYLVRDNAEARELLEFMR